MSKNLFKKIKTMSERNIKDKEMEEKNKEKNIENQDLEEKNKENFSQTKDTEKQDNTKTEKEEEKKEKRQDKKQTIEELGEKLVEINDKYLRLYSEFENYRKRTNKERLDLIQNASEETIKDLLPIIDDYERALNALSKDEDDKSKKTKEGLILIYNKFMNVLEKRGLKAINAKGEKFDENIHEAVTQFPAPKEEDKGKVLEEVTKGYYLNNKVIRYSKVVVAI